MSLSTRREIQLMLTNITCNSLVPVNHLFRRIDKLLDLTSCEQEFSSLYSKDGKNGLPVRQALRMMIVQFMQDYSDRQMEKALEENIAVKWFCGFELQDNTPDHSFFGKFRKRLGTNGVAKVFNSSVEQIRLQGFVGDVFQFIDSTTIITKGALWEERDKAIKDGIDKLNNDVVKEYAADPQGRFGCKGKNKFFFGYKRHISSDMRQGIITKIAVTPGNVPDGQAIKHVLNPGSMVIADKAYCSQSSLNAMRARGCHDGSIKKQNMKNKNREKDRWLSRLRSPFEGLFSKLQRRARYRGQSKVQMQAFMEGLIHNLKRWVVIDDALRNHAVT